MLDITGYELLEKIADGGMATVWKARQLSLDRIVAIKILDKNSLPDESAVERFRKEAQTAARLNHPNIVQVFDTGEVDGHAYLVMEFVEGQSVGEIISLHGNIKEKRALEIIEKTAEALSYAWDKECLIHCDVNPNNILIEQDTNNVKVTDLGIARMIGIRRRANEDNDLIVGTPNYTSPEQSAGLNDLDCRTDMYSAGATLYHMVTGVLPFHDAKGSGAMTRHEEDFLEDPTLVNPELSNETAWLIEKLLIKNRALRPMYWTQAIEDFREVIQGRLPKPPLPEEGESTVKRAAKRTASKSKKTFMMPGAQKKPTVKLAIKKKEQQAPRPSAKAEDNPVASAFRTMLILAFLAGVVYAGFYFYGKVKGPPEPVVLPNAVVEEPAGGAVTSDTTEDESSSPGEWRNEDFLSGARYFNQALADYKSYQQNRTNPEILKLVEENCREAIAYFEAAIDDAPAGVNINEYIKQANNLIFDAHQSMPLDLTDEKAAVDEASSESKPTSQQLLDAQRRKRSVLRVNNQPAPVSEPVPEPEPEKLLKVSLVTGWENPVYAGGAFSSELVKLLSRHVEPTTQTDVDPSVVLYPGITCMMKAKDAAEVLQTELPLRRALETPGFLTGSLFSYTFEGNFFGARELTLICDRNDRVVMAQLFDDKEAPSKMKEALFSSNWSIYDFIGARKRSDTDGMIAHQVRRRAKMIRIDTELAGPLSGQDRTAAARVALMMPVRMAGMLLQANQ